MSKRILNDNNCEFYCPVMLAPGSITHSPPGHTFKDGDGYALTKNTALSGNGFCKFLTATANGVLTSCTLQGYSIWTAGFEPSRKINGAPLLNEAAVMLCPSCPAGVITVIMKPPISIPPIGDFLPEIGVKTGGTAQDPSKLHSGPEGTPPREQPEPAETEHLVRQQEEKQADALCEICERANECRYIQTPDTLPPDKNASNTLRENSSEKEAAYCELANKKMEESHISWNKAAHHMISRNAAYCNGNYRQLVKLGNYFGYDINCQENCCFLPCLGKDDAGFRKKESHFKNAQAYEVMKASGLQWHVGNHQYTVNLPESVLNRYPLLKEMDCYNVKINKELEKIQGKCQERFHNVCIEKDYEEHRRWFMEKMNGLSAEIEKHLDMFSRNPRDSHPYFVSSKALKYAYEIPRSGKVISIHKTKTQWILKRYQYTNYQKDPDIQLNLLETKALADAENHRDATIKSLILFCENVTCFLVIDETMTFKLPFSYMAKPLYISYEDANKVKSLFSEMLAEQVDSEKDEYVCPNVMIYQRLKECGLR